MCSISLRTILDFSSVITLVLAMAAIYYSNRNSRHAILTGKQEELYQVIDQISQHYYTFTTLFYKVEEYRNKTGELRSIADYMNKRDEYLKQEGRLQIEALISRLEVLAKCYTKAQLVNTIMDYHRLINVMYQKVAYLQSLQADVLFKDGFPNFDKHREIVDNLKEEILKEIKIK